MGEEDVRQIVRKSLDPEHGSTERQDKDNNETENTDASCELMNQELPDDEDTVFNKMIEDALHEIHNFVPKRKRKEQPMFLDLNVENEKKLRVKNKGAPYYWHMPFRQNLYLKKLEADEIKDNISDRNDNDGTVTFNSESRNSRYYNE